MCTITYLPTGNDAFILTSNRDESGKRPTHSPSIKKVGGVQLLFPSDAFAGGTWICQSNQNRTACLMNGAFERHEWNPPYRKSRGLVLLDLMSSPKVANFFSDYDLDGIEPFTIIIYHDGSLTEFRWDGTGRFQKAIPVDKPGIWSSASMYPKPVREKREGWFEKWLQGTKAFTRDEILKFHRYGGEGDKENDFVMNRYDLVQTVSITCVEKFPDKAQMMYYDLIDNNITETKIEIIKE